MKLTDFAKTVLDKRYLRTKEDGTKETVEDMLQRVVRTVAAPASKYGYTEKQVRKLEKEFYEMIDNQDFSPNSPTYTGAGTALGQLSACYVLPIKDTFSDSEGGGIYDTMRDAALIHQTGGGTGFSFSRLRPNGDNVKSSQGVASGPVSFLKAYNSSTEAIKQGGTRRGANMGILRCDHPDIIEFITCKEDTTQITNFNLSVAITDKFIEALKSNTDYELINPRTNEPVKTLNAREVWDKLVDCAWKTGEPGVIFIDRMNRRNPNNHAEIIEASNPCGEQPLPPYGSCDLGSINLSHFVKNPYKLNAEVDWDKLTSVIHKAVIFLDQIIDVNKYPIPQLKEKALRDRRIGLGIMGWAEMLVQLNLAYNSHEAVDKAREVMSFIKKQSMFASMKLAEERGEYPEWNNSQWQKSGIKLRNATLTTVAPTGTISILMAQPGMPVSGGMEPKFALVITRNQAGVIAIDVDGQFATVAKEEGWYSDELMKKIAENGSCKGIDEVPTKWQNVFVVANEIEPEWHVKMQSAFQGTDEDDVITQPVDSACSKTINFPNSATHEDVDKAYMMAIDLGLKGITVYRDGSRYGQVLTSGTKKEEKQEDTKIQSPILKPRLTESNGKNFVIPTHFGNMTLDVHMDENNEPFEVMVNVGATGSDLMADAAGMGMLISKLLRLRSDVNVHERINIIIETLRDVGGSGSYGFGPNRVTSLASAIARGLMKFNDWYDQINGTQEKLLETKTVSSSSVKHELCPECKNYSYVMAEGCGHCTNCGYSACK